MLTLRKPIKGSYITVISLPALHGRNNCTAQELKDINMDSIKVCFLPKNRLIKAEPFHFLPHTDISFLHYSYHCDHGVNEVIKTVLFYFRPHTFTLIDGDYKHCASGSL